MLEKCLFEEIEWYIVFYISLGLFVIFEDIKLKDVFKEDIMKVVEVVIIEEEMIYVVFDVMVDDVVDVIIVVD